MIQEVALLKVDSLLTVVVQYYETAANLGDTDAMNEVAWCYLEGFGTKKDKVSKSFIFQLFDTTRRIPPERLQECPVVSPVSWIPRLPRVP